MDPRSTQITFSRTFCHAEQGQVYPVPFEIDHPIESLRVRLEVSSKSEEKSVIDLGAADPIRVRGWSGGARTEFFIGAREATPGYLAGPMLLGTWSVLLGAYQVPRDGCTAVITVDFEPVQPAWLKGDLHMHTFHSDGTYSPEQTADMVQKIGLDFIALTDHNTVSQNYVLPKREGLIVIPGMELTTYKGHANLLGVTDPLPDFRVDSRVSLDARARLAHAAGAKIVMNHPHDDSYPGCAWGWGMDWDYDWVEVWNGPWRTCNNQTLAWWQEQLVAGRRLVAVGGSDLHGPHLFVRHGMPTNWVYCASRTPEAILAAIDEGKVFLSFSPDGPVIDLCCGDTMMGGVAPASRADVAARVSQALPGDTVRIVTEHGTEFEQVLAEGETERNIVFDAAGRRFCRVEVWRPFPQIQLTMMAAMSNPIYFQ